jgi:hypothetical protein
MSSIEDVLKEIEKSYLLFFRRRGETAVLAGDKGYNVFWRALEELAEVGRPTWWATVEIDGVPSILVVIDDAVSVIHLLDDDRVETIFAGRLEGGRYQEVITGDDGYSLEGTFEHERLPGTLKISASEWKDFERLRSERDMLRSWASSPSVG